jgi:hypothetical protein
VIGVAPSVLTFTDVPKTHKFVSTIEWAASVGLTSGCGAGKFCPDNAVNRGSMAALLYRMAGKPAWTPPAVSPFADVSTSHQFYREITWLYEQRITRGVTANGVLYYQPDNPVTRGSASAFLYRMAGSPAWNAPSASPFTDVATSHNFYSTITWMAHMKITAGTGNGSTYTPDDPVNRGAMTAFLQRLTNTGLHCTAYPTGVGC